MHGTEDQVILMPDRIIKESICTSDTLNQLSDFEERFWHRLIVNCDDYGRFDARPAILKGRLFPLMESKTLKNIADALERLASVGLVELYEVDGKPFLHVVTWDKYQRIRAKRSKFPAPDSTCCQMTSNDVKCCRNPIQSESNPNPNPNPSVSRAKRFTPPTLAEVQAYVAERHSPVDPQGFIDFYESKGWMVGRNPMKDWKAACRNAEKWDRWGKTVPKEAGSPQMKRSLEDYLHW